MKLRRAAAQPFLQGATQAVNTHLLRAKVCHTKNSPSTRAGTSHFAVPTNQIVTMRAIGFVRLAVHIQQLALLELLVF